MRETPEQHARYKHFAAMLAQWIENNLETKLDISVVAVKAGYSRWHLQRIFKSVTGQSLATYIRLRRLTASALMLRSSQETILSIAMRYHFDSQQSFSRTFKKHFGQAPQSYRRQTDIDDAKLFLPYAPEQRQAAEERAVKTLPMPGYAAETKRPAYSGARL
ncbi:helix-turn-helix domain-containing protein [Enterobacillus tribolii]|uniref:Helix-turn-helix protein n=1 Tax=Enterobacillus tribolii TaxID=1487935 RepID=A0A370QU49_9GAMM|nr:helix-turn-helix domain-containing protein [Enterobacillus tribolii]RDK92774.1 helix-turn-helix protein [Enterobacillus tribolii]